MVINITCFKIPGSGVIFVASEYPSMTNKEIIQYNNVLFTQAPIRVCLHGTNIDNRTILVTILCAGILTTNGLWGSYLALQDRNKVFVF